MIIKSFTAESSAAALKRVREEMGGDAIVLKTRRVSGINNASQVEITACIESPTVAQASVIMNQPKQETPVNQRPVMSKSSVGVRDRVTPVKESTRLPKTEMIDNEQLRNIDRKLDKILQLTLKSDENGTTPAYVRQVAKELRQADLPEEFIQELITSSITTNEEPEEFTKAIQTSLTTEITSLICEGLPLQKGDRVIFLGPAGSGKTSVMGKIAAQLVAEQKQKIKLAGLDFQKIAAHEELAVYADLLDIELDSTVTGKSKTTSDTITLIDSPAIPADEQDRTAYTQSVIASGTTHRVVVFSALMRSRDIVRFAEQFKPLSPTHIVMSMGDLTQSYGVAIAAAKALEIPVAGISDSPGGVGLVTPINPDVFAQTMLNMEKYNCEQA